jgi:photosystem II cytochrome c550
MTYDGSEENLLCRQVSETWMPQQQVEKLAAFVLRAAEKAPGWATETFEP